MLKSANRTIFTSMLAQTLTQCGDDEQDTRKVPQLLRPEQGRLNHLAWVRFERPYDGGLHTFMREVHGVDGTSDDEHGDVTDDRGGSELLVSIGIATHDLGAGLFTHPIIKHAS